MNKLINLEMERRVLSAVFADPELILRLRPILLPDDFSDERHRIVFEVMLELLNKSIRPTLDQALLRLEDLGWLDRAGSDSYVVGLASSDGYRFVIDAPVWAERLSELANRRGMCRLANEIETKAQDMRVDAAELRRRIVQLIVEGKTKLGAGEYAPLSEYVADASTTVQEWLRGELRDVVPTGIPKLDNAIGGGLGKAQYTIIAGRPGMGKTYLAENILRNAEADGQICAFASLEMRGVDLAIRDICREARVSIKDLRNKRHVGDDEVELRVRRAVARVQSRTTLINDCSNQTAADMQISMMLHYLEHGRLDLLVVDYLELMGDVTGSIEEDGNDGRRAGVVIAGRRLKALAKSVGCAVVGLSQVTKAGATNPTLDSLMFGGEAEADLVLICSHPWAMWAGGSRFFMHPEMKLIDGAPNPRDYTIRVAKGRYCSAGNLLLGIEAQYGIIDDGEHVVVPGGRQRL